MNLYKRKVMLVAAWAVVASGSAVAQEFPARPVTLVVPFNAGGGVDGTARALAKGLAKVWDKPVIVENVAGADGLIGTQKVARAPADGHTVLLSVPNLLVFRHAKNENAFNAMTGLTPVSLIARYPVVVMASNASGIRSTADLLKKCKPEGACSWGSGEQFSWLAGQSVLDAMGVSATHVPYKGTAPVVNDVLGGHLTLGVGALAAPLQHYKSGALQLVAGFADVRSPSTPNVPTLKEAGVRGVTIGDPWYGLFAPKNLSASAQAAWQKALAQLQKDPAVQAALASLNAEPVFSSAEAFTTQVSADDGTFEALVAKHPLPQ